MSRSRSLVAAISALILATGLALAADAQVSLVNFQSHKLSVNLQVDTHEAVITDVAEMSVGVGWNAFVLARGAAIKQLLLDSQEVSYVCTMISESSALPDGLKDSLLSNWEDDSLSIVLVETSNPGSKSLSLTYSAVFCQNVDDVRFSNERVGNEVTATILERGAYLSPAAAYYPQGAEQLSQYSITVIVPTGWTAISDGNPIDGGEDSTFSFSNPHRSDGLYFFAAPFVVGSANAGEVEVKCLFFEEDSALIKEYLDACVGYVKQYSELIGPYPYKRFSVVENFFPTGYGMPGWTLLGQQVLRLPFIKYTSLGHEVLHNWWGNSVLVDYERGNWCEGLTVYGADFRYKLMQSPDAAVAYRKDILKQYLSYVDEGNDFPLRRFTSRSSPETRTIGYNKAMMVFHMIHETIGDSAFFDAWRLVYEKYKGVKVSWEEWIAAYEETSSQDLSWVVPQWVDRTGAPFLSVTSEETIDDGQSVRFAISNGVTEVYKLAVPVRCETVEGTSDTTLSLDSNTGSFTLTAKSPIRRVTVDPDYDLFRRLHPDEAEPIISAPLGNDRMVFATLAGTPDELEAFEGLARNLTGDTGKVSILQPPVKPVRDASLILLGDGFETRQWEGLVSKLGSDSLVVDGKAYPLKGYTFVLSARNLYGFVDGLVIESGDAASLPRIGQLLPHYGKYSYLIFEGAKNIDKGQWPVTTSPMSLSYE